MSLIRRRLGPMSPLSATEWLLEAVDRDKHRYRDGGAGRPPLLSWAAGRRRLGDRAPGVVRAAADLMISRSFWGGCAHEPTTPGRELRHFAASAASV